MRLKHSTSGVGGMGSAGVIGMPTSGRWSSSGNRRDTPVSGLMHRPSADGPSGGSPLPTGFYRIAPTFGNRSGQYMKLIYPTHSH
jgi:hypothetical protein